MEMSNKMAALLELCEAHGKKVNLFLLAMVLGLMGVMGVQALEISRLQGLVQYHVGERTVLMSRLEKVVEASEQLERHSYDIERYLQADFANILTDTGIDVIRKLGLQKPHLFSDDPNYLARSKRPKVSKSSKIKVAQKQDDLLKIMDTIATEQKMLSVNLAQFKNAMEYKRSMIDGVPAMVPVAGWMSSGFGSRTSPFSGNIVEHNGVDIAAETGSPIVSPADGIIRYAGDFGSYGNFLAIEHNFGIVTRYGHAEKLFVKPGDRVIKGQLVATVGSTGRSTGPHLHYEMWVKNEIVNPKAIMRGVAKSGETNTLAALLAKRPHVVPMGMGGEDHQ
jgi:murein DD-endopeptidase MepM/ murein hydrolase activator NlpD